MRRALAPLALGALALLSLACNRGAAQEALQAAEQALAAAPGIEEHAPEEHAAIKAVILDARASLAAGRYTDALRSAQALPDRIAAAARAAAKPESQAQAEHRPPLMPAPAPETTPTSTPTPTPTFTPTATPTLAPTPTPTPTPTPPPQ